MGAIKNVFIYSDSALIVYRKPDEPLASIYVRSKANLILELARREVDDEDAMKIATVEKQVYLNGRGFNNPSRSKRTLDLDTHETRYLTNRQKVFEQYAKNERFSPIKKSVKPQLIEFECFGPEEDRSIAVGGVAPHGEHWLGIALSVETAIRMIGAAGINPDPYRARLAEAERSGLMRDDQAEYPAYFFGELAFVVNCAAAILRRLSLN